METIVVSSDVLLNASNDVTNDSDMINEKVIDVSKIIERDVDILIAIA